MNRPLWMFACAVAVAACGGGKNVVVRASMDDAGGQPIADLPVTLVPYDQNAILDSIARDDSMPQPRLPKDAVARLRSLQADESAVKAKGDTAGVRRIETERRAYLAQLDSVRKARAAWIKDVQDDYDSALKDWNPHGYAVLTDTTDRRGRAPFGAEPGKWWVVARYVLPDAVLEWSVPVTAQKKDSVVVRLSPKNARMTPFF
jgi:hypothetical protein